MDISSILAFKSCFLGLRTKGTLNNLKNKQMYTALANGGRVAVTASQSVVPLFDVANNISKELPNSFWKKIASNPKLNKIVQTIDSPILIKNAPKIPKIARFLSKFGLAANIIYEFAKPLDAKESKKTEAMMGAIGNISGMYLFENLYKYGLSKIPKQTMQNFSSKVLTPTIKNILPKAINPLSLIIGAGFVCASLLGCSLGEKFMKKLYKGSNAEKTDLEYEQVFEKQSQSQPQPQNLNKTFLA